MTVCPTRLHIIWLGSMPPNTTRHPHRRRLLEWVELNPTWDILVWTDRIDREAEQLNEWCSTHGLQHRSIWSSAVLLWGTEESTVKSQIEHGFYANASDLLRLRILYQWGGIYVDSDVEPTSFANITLPLGIGLSMQRKGDYLDSIAPHVIASVQGHTLLQLALWQGVSNCVLQVTIDEQDFRLSDDPTERFGCTLVLTGDILRPALLHVFGLLEGSGWGWSPWLEALRLPFSLVHRQEHTWLEHTERMTDQLFFPPTLGLAIAQSWTNQALTSILHWTAQYSEGWMIELATQTVLPFENYFGYSPQGAAIKLGRSSDIIKEVPSI